MKQKKYWFGILPHVYYVQKKNKALLYNTETGTVIITDNKTIIRLLKQMHEKQNLGVISIDETVLKKREVADFVQESSSKNSCFITEIIENQSKPVQLMPVLNLQQDISRLLQEDDRAAGEQVLHYLSDLTIYLTESCIKQCRYCGCYDKQFTHCHKTSHPVHFDFTLLQQLLQQLQNAPLRKLMFTGGNIFEYQYFNELLSWLEQQKIYPVLGIHYKNTDITKLKKIKKFPLEIFITFPVNMDDFRKIFRAELDYYRINFVISGKLDYETAASLIKEYSIKHYQFNPFYTGTNRAFFEENIYITADDIFATPIAQRTIFARQKLNTNYFGALHIYANGDVKATSNTQIVGNLHQSDILQIAENELIKNTAWRQLREQEPCCDCLYQYLCPSLSNYEQVIGQHNLCHLHIP